MFYVSFFCFSLDFFVFDKILLVLIMHVIDFIVLVREKWKNNGIYHAHYMQSDRIQNALGNPVYIACFLKADCSIYCGDLHASISALHFLFNKTYALFQSVVKLGVVEAFHRKDFSLMSH